MHSIQYIVYYHTALDSLTITCTPLRVRIKVRTRTIPRLQGYIPQKWAYIPQKQLASIKTETFKT